MLVLLLTETKPNFRNMSNLYFVSVLIILVTSRQNIILIAFIKDARSIYLYPYSRSQRMQYVKYTKKITLQKDLQNCVTNNVFLDKTKNTQQQPNKTSNIKTLA